MTHFKSFCATVMFAMTAGSAMAGGLLTNTNQNAAYLRQFSQNAIIDITGLYFNPAGTAFLEDGWHLSLNTQTAIQTRTIDTTFPLFAFNVNDPKNTTHTFEGKAFAPVIPSFQLSYNHDKWSVNANFALAGGGGKCEFKDGLGSFEALYAGQILAQKGLVEAGVLQNVKGQVTNGIAQKLMGGGMPSEMALAQAQAIAETGEYNPQFTGYSLNPYMKGRQYYFALTLGGTYKITDYLAASLGIRGVYATCNYNGYVSDVKAHYAYSYNVEAAGLSGQDTGAQNLNSDLSLNADQTGFGITPIIGLDCKINDQWNVALKYELPTVMKLKNSTEMNEVAKAQAKDPTSPLAQFADGTKVREDIPAILAVGAQYSPISAVRINAGVNYYFDKQAKKYGDKQDLLDDNSFEVTAGAEWDICKYITVSASWQNTNYAMSDAYMNDLSFNLSSNSIGCGLRVNATERCSIDLGYMHTMYGDKTVVVPTQVGEKTDVYNRTNNVFGLGVNLKF